MCQQWLIIEQTNAYSRHHRTIYTCVYLAKFSFSHKASSHLRHKMAIS